MGLENDGKSSEKEPSSSVISKFSVLEVRINYVSLIDPPSFPKYFEIMHCCRERSYKEASAEQNTTKFSSTIFKVKF